MLWLVHDASIPHGRREPNRDGVEVPVWHQRLELRRQLTRCHFRAGFKFAPLRTRNHHLHIGTANVDDENSLLHYSTESTTAHVALSSTLAIGTRPSGCAFLVEPPSFFMRSRDTPRN